MPADAFSYTFSVFTPTLNRAHTLPRVCAALQAQTYRDFEWLIIDDGSTDVTPELVRGWQAEGAMPIQYHWQTNAGKHAAVNHGVAVARGAFFLFLDSDDACVPTALERLKYHWDAIPAGQKERFSAVSSLAQDPDGRVIGSRFPFDPTDSDPLEIRLKYQVTGEKWGFHRTDVLRQFPYPRFGQEKALPESLLWNRIALRYKTRYVNEPLEIYYPAPDGWGKNSTRIRARNPHGTRQYYREFVAMDYPIPPARLLREYANYVRYSLHAGVGFGRTLAEIPAPLTCLLAWPVGLAAFWRDRRVMGAAPPPQRAAPEGRA
ncbi:MAG TPA: glycosyltransferase family 2 protein [Anaerolineaceae bacterium]|nr:glycosyltransferase family 2 protein [Anaerolineaceae bacterium]